LELVARATAFREMLDGNHRMSNLRRIITISCAFVALVVCVGVKAQPRDPLGKINGEVIISFRAEELSAKMTYEYIATEQKEEAVTFYLNEAFNVKQVRCELCQSFDFDRQAKPRPSLNIKLKKPLTKGKRLPITIEYAGSLKDIYNRDHKFLELGLDWFWYPTHKNTSEFKFLYRLAVKTDEPNFQLVSNGRIAKNAKGWLVTSRVPDFDIDLILGEGLKINTDRQGTYNLQVVSKGMPDDTSTALLAGIKDALDFYNSTFGSFDPQREVTGVFRPYLEPQFGYFRKGYFVLPQVKNARDILFPISHELAHHWWLNAGQQHAWLNESFAEYSAMLFLRKQQGVEAFQKMMDDKRKRSANLPPVYGFDRSKDRQNTPGVFYRKGVVKLSELEDALGEQKFMDFMRAAAQASVKDTDTLIKLLARVSSPEVAEEFLRALKE
jgi:hypothetical protein